jgi:hypothetical protein
MTKDIEEVRDITSSPLSDGIWYFHIRSVDNAGNWSNAAAHLGPFYIGCIYNGNGGPLTAGFYTVTDIVTVPQGKTLTIKPGAKIYFNPGCKIIANGTLEANGTQDNPICFYLAGEEKPRMKLYHQLQLRNGGELKP